MPLCSVQSYIKNMLDGLQIPGSAQTLEAFITVPAGANLDGPMAFILGGRLTGRRQTAPRGKAFKHLAWVVDVYLAYETNPNSPTVDVEFPQIVDAVMLQTWQTTMPLFLDPYGNPTTPGAPGSSQIISIGEDFELELMPDRTPATLRMLYCGARLGLDVYEAYQG